MRSPVLPTAQRTDVGGAYVRLVVSVTFLLCCWASSTAWAVVERMQVERREVLANGQSFGAVGVYEIWQGKLHFAVDPEDPANGAIVDVSLAPRGSDGKVRFHSDFVLVQPRDPKHRQGTLLLEPPNRGRRTLVDVFHAPGRHSGEGSWTENPLLLEGGFRMLWVGWQADTPFDSELLSMQKVEAAVHEDGLLRSDHVFTEPAAVMPLAHRNHRPYGVYQPENPRHQLTARSSVDGQRQVVPRERWRFARLDGQGTVVPDPFWIHLDGGFEAGKIYEVVYVGRRPWVVGLGLAALRDAASFFKYPVADKPREQRVIAFGASQSGRLLRHMLYQGFASDEKGRQVFDGVWIHGAGAGRGSFNHRFAEPSREAHGFSSFLYPTDLFPFSGTSLKLSDEGRREGLYDVWRTASDRTASGRSKGTLPAKVMITHTSYEYWGRAASLTHTTPDGKADLQLEPHERLYLLAGTQHFVDSFPPRAYGTRYTANPHSTRFAMRALLVALEAWVAKGTAPPDSRYPKLADGSLVVPGKVDWPVPGVALPQHWYRPRHLDFGPRFRSHGIIDHQPPTTKGAFAVAVPQVGDDGNERVGIRMPEVIVPVATYSGWNLRAAKIGAGDQLADYRGSFFPLRRNLEDRRRANDPRLSLDERYGSREEYLRQFEVAAEGLVKQRLLLSNDLPAVVSHGAELWDSVQRGPTR